MSASVEYKMINIKPTILKHIILLLAVMLISACTTLQEKIAAGDESAIELAIESNTNINNQDKLGVTALMMAVQHQPNAVPGLIKAGADLNLKDNDGWSALMYAAYYQPSEITTLLAAGADVALRSNTGDTVLGIAAQMDSSSVLVLLTGGADVNSQNNTGATALMHAATHKSSTIQILLDAGANIDARGENGTTALMFAAAYQPSSVLILLKAGADQTLKNIEGLDAYYYSTIEPTGESTAILNSFNAIDETDLQEWNIALGAHKKAAYKQYLSQQPNGKYINEAKIAINNIEQDDMRITKQKLNQACQLRQEDWVYLSNACSQNYANGKGKAENDNGLTFVGVFENGYRIEGEIFANGILMYDGTLKDDKPHGSGICMHQGEPEECKYYKGKRVDTLYKQRIEFAKQNALMVEQQAQMDKKLAEFSNTRQLANQSNNGQTMGDHLTNQLKRKAADKAADYLFDQLF